MARLRYNNATGKLGAPLTAGGTTITFASAPPFATLAGSDYIPIVLEPAGTDSSGNATAPGTPSPNFEVVHLTAYTAGQTTGTMARGQEGTSGVAHNNGVVWDCGPVAYDVEGDAAWNVIGGLGQPAFQNGWANYGGSNETCQFRKTGDGLVVVEGTANPAAATAPTVFTLPAGYRPAGTVDIPAIMSSGGVTSAGEIFIKSTGDFTVQLVNGAVPGDYAFLTAVFFAEQ